jgi:hypothetical protein
MATALTPAAQPTAIAETASTAVAAQARASVEARFLVAMQRPRNWLDARSKLLEACKRPAFAETAMYERPIGDKTITGPSIRFAEEALRAASNMLAEAAVVFDDEERRIVRVTVTDLEANLSFPLDVLVRKTIERKRIREGQTVIARRLNTKGELVYIIEATEDELLTKQQALTSKAIRTSGLRLIPSDIIEEAIAQVGRTLKDADAADPAAAKKKIVDLFYAQGVGVSDIEEYLGHKIDGSSPAEIGKLRLVWQAIKEGETTWSATIDQVRSQRDAAREAATPTTRSTPARGTEAIKAKLEPRWSAIDPKVDPEGAAEMERQRLEDEQSQGGAS